MEYNLLEESLSKYKDYKNICLYHSVYVWLKVYVKIDLDKYLEIIEKVVGKDMYSDIENLLLVWDNIREYLLEIGDKKIINNLFLGIFLKDKKNLKVNLKSYVDLGNINSEEIKNGNYKSIKMYDRFVKNKYPILLLNDNEHFEPIIITKMN